MEKGTLKTQQFMAYIWSVVKSEQHIIEEKVSNRVIALHIARVMPVMQRAKIYERLVLFPGMAAHMQPHVNVIGHAKHRVRNGPRNQKRTHVPRSADKGRGEKSKHISKLVVDLRRFVYFGKKLQREVRNKQKQKK